MKQLYFSAIMLVGTAGLNAQSDIFTLNFEAGLPLDSFWDGSDLSGGYVEGVFMCGNDYDTSWGGYWSGGFAVSTMRDSTDGSFANLYSARPASGHESNGYSVVHAFSEVTLYTNTPYPLNYGTVWLTNSTYAWSSMKNGDMFAKKFGGPTGNDPDYFFVRVRSYLDSSSVKPLDSVDFYLADFRFSDNGMDYILDDWKEFSFPNGMKGKKLTFQLYSSDVGSFGMNTPAYFSMDNLKGYSPVGVAKSTAGQNINVNQRDGFLVCDFGQITEFALYDISGRVMLSGKGRNEQQIPIADLSNGMYVLSAIDSTGLTSFRFVK